MRTSSHSQSQGQHAVFEESTMEEHAEFGKLSLPKKLHVSGLVFLPILVRPDGPAELRQIPLYFRKDLASLYTDLGKFLASPTLVHFHLTGPPGSGKTCFVTLVCRMWAEDLLC